MSAEPAIVGMNYEQAIAAAKAGTPVMRPHWCWVQLCFDPGQQKLFIDHEDGERKAWRPYKNDLLADDWRISPLGQAR